MSTKYPGGFITKSPVAPTNAAASGVWTLDQQQQAQKAGTWPAPPNYIEEVFSTWLYNGTGASQTITNGIDVSGKGGLVWIKARSVAEFNVLVDTARGASKALRSSSTAAEVDDPGRVSAFTSSGFSIGTDGEVNGNGNTQASWTFREQPKFFDVVTWTGDGVANRQIPHNLGAGPGCVIVKKTNGTTPWPVYHRSLANQGDFLSLNATTAVDQRFSSFWGTTPFSSTTFSVSDFDELNGSGGTYVAYVFAHNAGGFGLTGTDNVISCGSYTGTEATLNVSLGYEAQWVLIKPFSGTGNWTIMDNIRGMTPVGTDGTARLRPNTSEAESTLGGSYGVFPNATGFTVKSSPGVSDYNASGTTYIYVAIRRGPMKTPTVGTSVFSPQTATYTANQVVTTGFTPDMILMTGRTAATNKNLADRLRGFDTNYYLDDPKSPDLFPNTTDTERLDIGYVNLVNNTGYRISGGFSGFSSVNWNFARAPGFFDEACYTGTGSNLTLTHNLGVAPEFAIIKARDKVENWVGWSVYGPASGSDYLSGNLNDTASFIYTRIIGTPTATQITVSGNGETGGSGFNYVAYLFATCPGVSKVGSYTGTGALQTVNCGFTTGVRFVLIKRTDSTGDWWVYDSARGITSGNDPYTFMNSTAVEVTGTNYVDTTGVGFQVTAAAPAGLNASGGTYIFLAIA